MRSWTLLLLTLPLACRLRAGERARRNPAGSHGFSGSQTCPRWPPSGGGSQAALRSDLSFRVTGKLVARRVDVGAMVKQGDTLASLDVVDYQNRLRSAEADGPPQRPRSSSPVGRSPARQALEERLDAAGELRRRAAQSALRRGQACRSQGNTRSDPRPAQLYRAQSRFRWRHHLRRRRSGPECGRRPDGGEARPTDSQRRRVQPCRDGARRSPRRGRGGHRLAALEPAADN